MPTISLKAGSGKRRRWVNRFKGVKSPAEAAMPVACRIAAVIVSSGKPKAKESAPRRRASPTATGAGAVESSGIRWAISS
jgi:hypothetical protein